MAKLVVISKAQAGLSYSLGKHWSTIGRSPGNVFQIPEASVSGQHCEVFWRGDELTVRDMRSTNGTFINDSMISEGVLRPGEVLRLGEVELRLEVSAVNGASSGDHPLPDDHGEVAAARQMKGSPAGRRHQVLLVDDSMAFLEMAGEVFEAFSSGAWEVHRACGADEALGIMQQRQIELAVLDLNMPVLDGLQLLTMLHRRHPDVKKVALTAMPNDTHRGPCLAAGAELFLEKPITRDGLRFVFNVLNDSITWKQREGFSGTLQQVGLVDIIQIECLRRNSCILEVHTGQLQGQIYIESGVIVHAAAGGLSGEKALHRLLSLNDGQFNLYPYRPPAERTVHGSWEWLIMESARVRDEERSVKDNEETAIISRPGSEDKSLRHAEVAWGLETGAD
jgi:CheY-like chemotaxis protein